MNSSATKTWRASWPNSTKWTPSSPAPRPSVRPGSTPTTPPRNRPSRRFAHQRLSALADRDPLEPRGHDARCNVDERKAVAGDRQQ
ncbi:hypothetical protein NNJEOMEG_00131 [Fundidesulfovibrio magnetotacticus]|uniref:Uncharacterized protein n=1 Tax=Fundidesulfovibrio magnetotacticus TaxID=2730080 RepID=A0A6V8LPP4_9BACT|nr:hypothetical protein NNJEOMEG_00131 [Fundidesulfovibrio magnetotacticus]